MCCIIPVQTVSEPDLGIYLSGVFVNNYQQQFNEQNTQQCQVQRLWDRGHSHATPR